MADILIVGQGPAGVSAALYALRAGLTVQMVAKGSGGLLKAHEIENYYGLERPVSGLELENIGKAQALRLGAELLTDEISDLLYDGSEFVARSAKNEYRALACILATGAVRQKKSIARLQELEGHGVSYCAVCDAFFFRKKNVAVLGAGEYALHEAEELAAVGASITILTNGDEPTAVFPESFKIETRKIKGLLGDERLKGICLEDGEEISFDGLFVALGTASALDLARKTGAAFEKGKPVLNRNFETTLPGLFAAGDCTGGILQVAVAVGEGARAGLSAIDFVRQRKLKADGK